LRSGAGNESIWLIHEFCDSWSAGNTSWSGASKGKLQSPSRSGAMRERQRLGNAATAVPVTFVSPSPFTTEHSRSMRCSLPSSYFLATVIRVLSSSPGQVCFVKRTL
jgi:hypothetical protein